MKLSYHDTKITNQTQAKQMLKLLIPKIRPHPQYPLAPPHKSQIFCGFFQVQVDFLDTRLGRVSGFIFYKTRVFTWSNQTRVKSDDIKTYFSQT